MRFLYCAALCFVLLATSAPALAQTPPPQDLLNQRYLELVGWLDQFHKWEAWQLKWGNKIAYNTAGGVVKDRPLRPYPPAWLWDDCKAVIAADGKLGEACRILADWDDLDAHRHARNTFGLARTDVPQKTSFLQRIHLSGGWVPAQMPAPKVYLVAGMEVGIVELGRLTLPAVGVGLIAMSNGNGYEWKPATVLGIGYRLASFAFPGVKRQANLHLNVARVTIHGARTMSVGLDPSQNLVGFSLTFNKAR